MISVTSAQIARQLRSENIPIPTAYAQSKGRGGARTFKNPTRWGDQTVNKILDRIEYAGHTANFKTHKKSYKHKKKLANPRDEWMIFENTHEPIISQHDFDLVREMRKNKRKIQKCGEVNPFSGMVYCADCGAKMYLCRSRSLTDEQEHLKCSTYANDSDECSAHYIRTAVLRQLILSELNKLLETVHANEDAFVNAATPEIMHELVEKIVVHAPDKLSGHREQRVEIYFRFNVASASAKLIEKNKLITYDALSELYGKEGQELIDAVTAEHNLICKLTDSGMSFEQIGELADSSSANKVGHNSFYED